MAEEMSRPSFSGLLTGVKAFSSASQWAAIHNTVSVGSVPQARILRLAPNTVPVLYVPPAGYASKLPPIDKTAQAMLEAIDPSDCLGGDVPSPDDKSDLPPQWSNRFSAAELMPIPVPEGHVRILSVSDTHTAHRALDVLPPADILAHAGDFTNVGEGDDVADFCDWLEQQTQFKHKVIIAGNHDLSLDEKDYKERFWKRFGHRQPYDSQALIGRLKRTCVYLDHEGCEVDGLRIFGTPYQPEFFDWAFNLSRRGQCYDKWKSMVPFATEKAVVATTEEEATGAAKPDAEEPATKEVTKPFDLLISHGPPMGHGDTCLPNLNHEGCADLLDFIEAYSPKVHLFGHIHEGWGVTVNGKDRATLCVNPSTMNLRYQAECPNLPIVVDVPRGHTQRSLW